MHLFQKLMGGINRRYIEIALKLNVLSSEGWDLTMFQKVSYLQNCSQCGIPRKVMIVLREGAKKGTREFYVYCAHKMLDLRPKHGISKQVQLSKIVD